MAHLKKSDSTAETEEYAENYFVTFGISGVGCPM
jgi:hypothetical protein